MEKLLKKSCFTIIPIVLTLILILGFVLRFYQLGSVPSSLNRDEPAIGYNAYSILKTGKDEWGVKLPLAFKSFGDYKSPLYIYLTAISIFIFGPTEFSVRFWGALAGFLLIIFTYLFGRGLFDREDKISQIFLGFVLAISPWAVFYSRFSFEANLALLFNVIILYFLFKNNFKKINLLILFLFLFTFFTYSSSLIIWPIFIIVYFASILKKITQKTKRGLNFKLFFKILTFFLIVGLVFYKQTAIGGQKSKVTIFGDPNLRLTFNKKRVEIAQKNLWQARLFYNQYLYYGKIFFKNYFKSFSPNFLFGGGGGHPWHKIPQTPHLYPVFLFLILLGFLFFIKTSRINKEKKFFLILFFLLTPIPSAITIDAPHATRLLNLFFILTFLAGLGLNFLYKKMRVISLVILGFILFNLFQFSKFYFIDYKQNPPTDTLPGLKETIFYLKEKDQEADRIIFDNHSDGSYAYLLFYIAYPPLRFIDQIKRYSPDPVGLEWVEKFDKFVFSDGPTPDISLKEVYVLRGDYNLGQREIIKIKNKFNDKVYYTISANF